MIKKSKSFNVTVFVCFLSVCIMFGVLIWNSNKGTAFTPPPFEKNAIYGKPVVPDNLGWNEIDAKVYKVSVTGVLSVKNNEADIWFANSKKNTVWMKLRALDSDANILGETGLICPGEYVQTIYFDEIPQKGSSIELKIMAYEPETYYSAGCTIIKTKVTGGE